MRLGMTEHEIMEAAKEEARTKTRGADNRVYMERYLTVLKAEYNRLKSQQS